MDHNADVDVVRKKAIAYLHDFLGRCAGKSQLQTAESIVNLAFEDCNPVKDVFGAAGTAAPSRPSTAQPSDTIKSWLTKSLRRDNKNGPSESKAIVPVSLVCDPESMPPGASAVYAEILGDPPFDKSVSTNQPKKSRSRSVGRGGHSKAPLKPVPNSSVFSSSPNLDKGSCSNQYRCILCQDRLSSKGVCKRHLDEQHVTRKIYRCEKCGDRYEVKKEAKHHSDICGKGVLLYTVDKRADKKIYACEFTGKYFFSKPLYVEHLLELSALTEERPEADARLKLCALLTQPSLQNQVAEISSRKFESRHAWRNLQWSDAHVSKAIEELENATVHEDGMIELGNTHAQQKVRVYLNSLLGAGSLPRSNSLHSRRSRSSTMTQRRTLHSSDSGGNTPTQDVKEVPPLPTSQPCGQHSSGSSSEMDLSGSMPPPETVVTTVTAAERAKRHLSDQSRAFVPTRLPPGPPSVPHIPYGIGPSLPDFQQYMLPNTSGTSLPFRDQQSSTMIEQPATDLVSQRTGSTATPTLSSDGASESTVISSFQEPEYINEMPFEYNFWNTQQSMSTYPFAFNGNVDYNMTVPPYYYHPAGGPPVRTASFATDQTCVVDYNDQEQKLAAFDPLPSHDTAQYGATFFIDDDDFTIPTA